MRLTVHLLCKPSYRYRFVGGAVACNDAWLIHYDFVVLNNDGIGSAEVNSYFLCKEAENTHAQLCFFKVIFFVCCLCNALPYAVFGDVLHKKTASKIFVSTSVSRCVFITNERSYQR